METHEEDEYNTFHTKPMLEVFLISIHSNEANDPNTKSQHDGKPCEIRGIVRVLDDYGNKHDIYNRKMNDLETLNFGGYLSLNSFSIIASELLKFSIYLYDVAHDIEIALGVFDIAYRKTYDYDKVYVEKVDGKYGFAIVYYATFQHTLVADIRKVQLHNDVHGSSLDANLFGTIVARLERKFKKTNGDAQNEYPPVILFDNRRKVKESKLVQAKLDVPIKLFRSRVVVPFNCSLIIKADFCDNTGNKIVMDWQWSAYPLSLMKEIVRKQNLEIQVEINWISLFRLVREMIWENKKVLKSKLPLEVQQPSSSISRNCPHAWRPKIWAFAEVFSVLVYVGDNDLDICGTVRVIDDSGSCFIFDGKERCCGFKTLPIVSPRIFYHDVFAVDINMNDGKGCIVSDGRFVWNSIMGVKYFEDSHICSVIMGDIGYAVVHYSKFNHSLQARIRVSFLSHTKPDAFVNVFGSITAEYGNYEYSTPYDQKYYKSTLFSKTQDDCVRVNLASGSTLPLLKLFVSVPLDNSLILDVNLRVINAFMVEDADKQIQESAVMSKLVEFKPTIDGYLVFEESDYVISICVEWSFDSDVKDISCPILPDNSSLLKAMHKASFTA